MANRGKIRDNYWRTLIILSNDSYKSRLSEVSKYTKISRTKSIGLLIESYVEKMENQYGIKR